ncbi:P-loop NTPase fold protein [Streptococcus peroris]|uniref:KAP family P-loop domain protein n=1 Tax=Streptococcus peroris ATCC 700780 TaxID=888746 RepID=E8KCF7_9STRE|nr:P-loop NTPase fold protein [Streptococcus peroris]EFX40246.1 KAP family P-loop domain protein [Streptococcus peroris ATCC 700780]
MVEKNFIELDKIDTSTAAQNFAKLLNENKTYFLNGPWGSGKSTFLKEVDDINQIKLVTIDFWRLNDSRSTLETVFAKLHPYVYWGLRLIVILCIALSILMTNVVDLGLSVLVPTWVILSAGVVALIVAIHQFLKIKSDGIYSWLLTKNYPSFTKTVLVVDDFDRMTMEQQEASYKLFSLLKGKLPIIFIGDIDIIHRNESNYLSKIIDRRIELPFVLHPTKIWTDYFEQLEKRLEIKLSDRFKRVFITDERNLRDRERFNDYVNLELIGRNKEKYVQIEQQLVVIYLFLYYPRFYESLKTGKGSIKLDSNKQLIKELHNILFEKNNSYPSCYLSNREGYLINEVPSNRLTEELIQIIDEEQQLSNEILLSQNDFLDFINGEYEKLTNQQQDLLFSNALKLSTHSEDNLLVNLIIQKKVKTKIPEYRIGTQEVDIELVKKTYFFVESVLGKADVSEIFYFIFKHKIFRYQDMVGLDIGLSPYNKEFSSYRWKYIIIMMHLYELDKKLQYFDWDNTIWGAIIKLSTEEFLRFWLEFGFISNKDQNKSGYDSKNKEYIFVKDFDTYADEADIIFLKGSIKERLNKLEKEGFKFED